jgi:hypothetical protein
MRNKLRKMSLYIISMTANLSSLCALHTIKPYAPSWNKKKTDWHNELTFFTSNSNNLLKNNINCVSLFLITLYEEVWWHVSMWTKVNLRYIFSQISPSGFFILFHLKILFRIIGPFHITEPHYWKFCSSSMDDKHTRSFYSTYVKT